jgi:hypothetical protein
LTLICNEIKISYRVITTLKSCFRAFHRRSKIDAPYRITSKILI